MKLYEQIAQEEFKKFTGDRLKDFIIGAYAINIGTICITIRRFGELIEADNIYLKDFTEEELREKVKKFLLEIKDWPILANKSDKWNHLMSEVTEE